MRKTCLAFLALLSACSTAPREEAPGKQTFRIAVIPQVATHEFWKSVHAGAIKASRELDVEILWKGPLKEDDLKEQIGIVETFVSQSVSGIVLAPLNDKALVQAGKQTKGAKIPTVIFDSSLQGEEHVSYVATDNVSAAAPPPKAEEPPVVVGTPGRVIDHIGRNTLKLENLQMVIMYEADEMLNMGFREDMENILSDTPDERQTVLFSATMSKDILALTKKFQQRRAHQSHPRRTHQQQYFTILSGRQTRRQTRSALPPHGRAATRTGPCLLQPKTHRG